MRLSVPLRVRMLVRPLGAVGGLGAGAGLAAVVAAYLPWYEVVATVDLLGTTRGRAVAGLAGWQAHPWGWLAPALALVGATVCAAVAVDRPFRSTASIGAGAGIGLLATAAAGLVVFPPISRFDRTGTGLGELDRLADRLPEDVALSFSVRPGLGIWMTLVAAIVLIAAAAAMRGVR